MPRRQVVITGAGAVTALGCSVEALWTGLLEGRSGVAAVTRFDSSRFACRLAGEVDESGLRFADGPFSFDIQRMCGFVRYALAAGEQALAASGLANGGPPPSDGRVFMGVAMGGLPCIETGFERQERLGPRRTTPYLIPSLIPNMAASMMALRHGLTAPQTTIAGACASGSQALGAAMQAIAAGDCDWVMAGGAEAVTTPITYSGFQAMRALSLAPEADATPRPFDARRDGMVVGEGAAVFVLEERRRAEARGAPILGELVGFATNSGAEDIATISADRAAVCMGEAMADAGIGAADIDAVFAQSSGMVRGDASEMAALQIVFEGCRPAVTSIKGATGYAFAANGPLNLVAALMALRSGTIPPTRNFAATEDVFSTIDVVAAPRPAALRRCMINSFGFGGINAALVVAAP